MISPCSVFSDPRFNRFAPTVSKIWFQLVSTTEVLVLSTRSVERIASPDSENVSDHIILLICMHTTATTSTDGLIMRRAAKRAGVVALSKATEAKIPPSFESLTQERRKASFGRRTKFAVAWSAG